MKVLICGAGAVGARAARHLIAEGDTDAVLIADTDRQRRSAVATSLGSRASADKAPNPLSDRFQVTVGTFFITTHPTIQLDGESGAGDRVN